MKRHWYAYVAVAALACSAWWVAPTRAQFGGGGGPTNADGASEVDGALSQLLNKEAYLRVRLEGDLAMTIRGTVTALGERFVLIENEGTLLAGEVKASKIAINMNDIVYIGFDFREGR
jgi:hypothetical protein